MKKPIKHDLERWNELNPIGSLCELTEDDGSKTQTRTRSVAWELGHGQAVVKVEGKSGGWMLERIKTKKLIKHMKTNAEIIELLLPTLLELSEAESNYKSLNLALAVGHAGIATLELGVWHSSSEVIARGSSFEEVAKAIEDLKPEKLRQTRIAQLESELEKLKAT